MSDVYTQLHSIMAPLRRVAPLKAFEAQLALVNLLVMAKQEALRDYTITVQRRVVK